METKTKKDFARKPEAKDNSGKWINYAAEICHSKDDDKKFYMRVIKGFKALRKNSLQLIKYHDYLAQSVEKGFMTEEQAAKKAEERPWVRYVVNVPPQQFKEEDKFKKVDKNGWQNDVLSFCEYKKDADKPPVKYLKVDHDFEVSEGQSMPMKKYRDKIIDLKEKGFIDELQFNKYLENAAWLHYTLSLPPKKSNQAPDEE